MLKACLIFVICSNDDLLFLTCCIKLLSGRSNFCNIFSSSTTASILCKTFPAWIVTCAFLCSVKCRISKIWLVIEPCMFQIFSEVSQMSYFKNFSHFYRFAKLLKNITFLNKTKQHCQWICYFIWIPPRPEKKRETSQASTQHFTFQTCKILSDCNWTWAQNHLFCQRTLNHLAKLTKWLSCVLSTYLYGVFDCIFLSCHICVSEWIHTL